MSDREETGNDRTNKPEEDVPGPEEQPVCAKCGHPIEPDDIECPNCGISLVAG